MPKLDSQDLSTFSTPSKFGFSGVKIEDVDGASEYTLVTIVCDISGSVMSFERELEKCLGIIAESCQNSPRSSNLMIRLVTFNTGVTEIHGFRLLSDIDPDEYLNSIKSYGGTALFDASYTAIEASLIYGEGLFDKGIDVNGVIFIISDGDDNASRLRPQDVKQLNKNATLSEKIFGLVTVLVGVVDDKYDNAERIREYLKKYREEADIDKYVEINDSSAKGFAKLAEFVSQSISSVSEALPEGEDAKSVSLTI